MITKLFLVILSLQYMLNYINNFILKLKIPEKVSIGEQINGYKMIEKLGEGGFGAVYKVEDSNNEMYALFVCI